MASSPDGSTADVNQTARELATGLFGSWLSKLDGALPVIFQTSAEFGDLPFGLLPARQQPLAFEAVWAETHHAMDGLESKPIRTAVAVDAMEAPIPAGLALPLLPSASQELKAVGAAGWATLSLSGSAVNPARLAAAMASADLLHFAGHAIPRNDGAALLVEKGADGNALFELAKWPGKTPTWVVLSACGTARSSRDEVDTLTPAGLARAFLEKGTRQVIASYWEVDSNASVKFMQRFYGSLAVQGDSGRAMRDAMQTMKSDHPYYWGVYTRLIRG